MLRWRPPALSADPILLRLNRAPCVGVPNGARAKSGLSRSIGDAGWGGFVLILRAKAEDAGRIWIEVDPRHTPPQAGGAPTDGCEECGYAAAQNRVTQAVFVCQRCSHRRASGRPNGARAKSGLSRSIGDAGWGGFVLILRAKAEDAGRIWIEVDPWHAPPQAGGAPTDGCEECGYAAAQNRVTQAVFVCQRCSHRRASGRQVIALRPNVRQPRPSDTRRDGLGPSHRQQTTSPHHLLLTGSNHSPFEPEATPAAA